VRGREGDGKKRVESNFERQRANSERVGKMARQMGYTAPYTWREGRSESERTNQPVTFAPEGTNRHHHFRGHLVRTSYTRVHIYYIPDRRQVIDACKRKRKTFLFPKMSHLTAGE